jgi:hypothetical protein
MVVVVQGEGGTVLLLGRVGLVHELLAHHLKTAL